MPRMTRTSSRQVKAAKAVKNPVDAVADLVTNVNKPANNSNKTLLTGDKGQKSTQKRKDANTGGFTPNKRGKAVQNDKLAQAGATETLQWGRSMATFREGNEVMTMMVDANDPNEDNSKAESSEDSCDEGGSPSQQSYESGSDHDGDSVQIAQLSDSERERRLKELDAEMSEKMQQIHQLMAGGSLTGATRFIEQNFHLTEDRVRPLIAAVPPEENGKTMRKSAKGNVGFSPRQQNVNVNHKASHNPMELSQSMETIYHNAVEEKGKFFI